MMDDKRTPPPAGAAKHTNEQLYHEQMELLGIFLANGAITRAQYEKSAGDLTRLMGFAPPEKGQT